jgi:hypothetical protein
MNRDTEQSYRNIVAKNKTIFLKKNKDYGLSWSIMRSSSVTDQIFIKANRIKTIQETQKNLIGDTQEDEFGAIINYCIMAMMLLNEEVSFCKNISVDTLSDLYDRNVNNTLSLMQQKNTDYGEAWRDMRVSSMTDLILTKLLRIKQIEDNDGRTDVSEGAFSNYQDIMNYAIFSTILLTES